MREGLETLRGSLVSSATTQVATWAGGRICEHEGCGTHLSVYNPSSLCSVHQRAVAMSDRRHVVARTPLTQRVRVPRA